MTRRKANNSGTNFHCLPQQRSNQTGKYNLPENWHRFFTLSDINVYIVPVHFPLPRAERVLQTGTCTQSVLKEIFFFVLQCPLLAGLKIALSKSQVSERVLRLCCEGIMRGISPAG